MDGTAVALLVVALGCAGLGLAVGLRLGRSLGAATAQTGHTEERAAVEGMVRPLADTLSRVERHIQQTESDRSLSYGELREQVRAMHEANSEMRMETAALVTALRAPHVRGRWGEVQLHRIVEAAGMIDHCDFVEQPVSTNDDGVRRPDLVVTLTADRHIVVDAKVPFAGFIQAIEARDERERTARLRAHARHLRKHVDDLADRGYAERFAPSPEFVVLFVPSDNFLQAALEQEPALLEYAFDRDVVISTPSTLLALLRTVAYTWRQDSITREAQQVLALGRELHGRLATMGTHLTRLGGSLNSAVARYNETVGSLERKVLVSARRFTDLGVTSADLQPPAPLDATTRPLQAPELLTDEIADDPRYGIVPRREPGDPADPGRHAIERP